MKLVRCFAIAGLMAAASPASADAINYSIGTDLGYKQLEFSTISGTGTSTVKAELWTLAIVPAVAYGRYFGSLSVERSLGAATDATYGPTGLSSISHVNRLENSVTVGASLWGGLSVFVGYLDTETERFNTAPSAQHYKDKGPFAGLAYAHRLGTGSLGLSIAYAKSDADFAADFSGSNQWGTGDTTGASFSLTWSSALSDNWLARIGYRGTRYRTKLSIDANPTPIPAPFNQRDIDQNYDALFIGVVKGF